MNANRLIDGIITSCFLILLILALFTLGGCGSVGVEPSPVVKEKKEKEREPFQYHGNCEDFRFIAPPSGGVCEVVGQ